MAFTLRRRTLLRFLLLAAFALLFLTALSLPFAPALDLVRVHFGGIPSTGYGGQASLTELRVSDLWMFES